MKNLLQYLSIVIFFTLFAFFFFPKNHSNIELNSIQKISSSSSPKAGIKMKKARSDYFNRMLRDPKTNSIPEKVRQKELRFANELDRLTKSLDKTSKLSELSWQEAGPNNVGGRTRALAVDVTNPTTIIAGGASGGIWKSTDNGSTWILKSSPSTILSVTSIAQDPRPGKTNIWYYTTGEFSSNLAGSYSTNFTGDGIYKSIDNGETWQVLQSTLSNNFTGWDSNFDYVGKVEVSPVTGTVFIAPQALGIYRSTDEGGSFTLALGGLNEHINSDISVADDGSMVAIISSPFAGNTAQNSPGVYKSSDDGVTWTNITPTSFPASHVRSVIEIAPSNTNIAYVLTYTGNIIDPDIEDIRFHKIEIGSGASEDRSANMAVFPFYGGEERISQGSYNLTLAIKPDNENFVLIGATSLHRSTNGFATKPTDAKLDWIGGYHPTYFQYPNFHSDIHSFSFDPTNPNAMWWGHDGGLTYTSDITNTSFADVFPWENKNNGYNVTQFYHISIPKNAGDGRIMGGTQDNGTPYIVFNGSISKQLDDVSTGDGAYSYFGENYPYFSAQSGAVMRGRYDELKNPKREYPNWSNITPKDATNQLFIHPFVIDPNDENVMIYPAAHTIWRNDQLNSLPDNPSFAEGITDGWNMLNDLAMPTGYVISALTFSSSNPTNRLYYGGSDRTQQPSGAPKIYKLDNANTATSGAVDVSIAGVDPNTFVNSIAVNPDNADELIVIFSNYNIVGVYHSIDGGQSYNAIEGNLEGDENNPGPSIREATILPTAKGTQYFLATSIGVYSTSSINGNNTSWSIEGQNVLGNVIVSSIASRKSDGRVVAGTHGRGIFVGSSDGGGTALASVDQNSLTLQSNPGSTGTTSFVLKNTGDAALNYTVSVTGTFNGALNKFSKDKNVLQRADLSSTKYDKFREKSNFKKYKTQPKYVTAENLGKTDSPSSIEGDDYLFLDDGDANADDFVGWGDTRDFDWFNQFDVSGFNFELDSFEFYLRSENSLFNNIYAAIYDENSNLLSEGFLTFNLSSTGSWYSIVLNPTLSFADGDVFYIELYSYSEIPYPAGTDTDAQITNNSYYFDGTNWINLNTISGFENGAFLIRASGTKTNSGNGNQKPVAVIDVSKSQVEVNEIITFGASQSFDNDGQIVEFLWNFGDGSTSSAQSAMHSYSQAGSYTYSLTVTDNQGAVGQTTGEIVVGASTNVYVTVDPINGSIPPGGSQNITLSLDAQNLTVGTYTGQVNITTNGGNVIIPIDYLVDVEQISSLPDKFSLSQNYPNPFNPTTNIEFSLPQSSNVSLKIYSVLGEEVASLINEQKSAGRYNVSFDASQFSSGIYFYKMETESFTQSKKMLLIK